MNFLNFSGDNHVWSTDYDIVNLCANGWRKVNTILIAKCTNAHKIIIIIIYLFSFFKFYKLRFYVTLICTYKVKREKEQSCNYMLITWLSIVPVTIIFRVECSIVC